MVYRNYSNMVHALHEKSKRVMKNKVLKDTLDSPLWLSKSPVNVYDKHSSILDAVTNCNHYENKISEYDWEKVREFPDPFEKVQKYMDGVNDLILGKLNTDQKVLAAAAKFFFKGKQGKKFRPSMILLLAEAADGGELSGNTKGAMHLAAISEMLHTASLLHDDVIDDSEIRRGKPSARSEFGCKVSILAGDFVLARASVYLARLRNFEAVELMSTAIENLVKGEMMQLRPLEHAHSIPQFEYYLRKSYYKTGSLMSNSCQAVMSLNGHSETNRNLGYAFGKHLGLAFQLIDDMLDYNLNTGKPSLTDIKAGLATAPVLLAQDEFPQLAPMVERKFANSGDVDVAIQLVEKSSGLARTKELALAQADLACRALSEFPPSSSRDALAALALKVVTRTQ